MANLFSKVLGVLDMVWGVANHGGQDVGKVFGNIVCDRIDAARYWSEGVPLFVALGQSKKNFYHRMQYITRLLLLLLTAFPFFRGRHSESPFSILIYYKTTIYNKQFHFIFHAKTALHYQKTIMHMHIQCKYDQEIATSPF